jgi:hypothetical protein
MRSSGLARMVERLRREIADGLNSGPSEPWGPVHRILGDWYQFDWD